MGFIKNYDKLASSLQRKIVLDLVVAAFTSIQPENTLKNQVTYKKNKLKIMDMTYLLKDIDRLFLIGFGKGSAEICKFLYTLLDRKITEAFDIDVVDEKMDNIYYVKGTHPLPSQTNIDFTKKVLSRVTNLTERDLVLVVICGGGSVMFEEPYAATLAHLTETVQALLKSGARISEMNVIRKHLSHVKGGGLAKHLYPARIASLIFSDVPGNELSVIASGPTVKDTTTLDDAAEILQKYNILDHVKLKKHDFTELPHDDKYFEHVKNFLIVSNQTALSAMQKKAAKLGIPSAIYSDHIQGDALKLGKQLIDAAEKGQILLAGGESTVHVVGNGKGGRNQALVLSSLEYLDSDTIIAAFDSDGWDFYGFAGAIGDLETKLKAHHHKLLIKDYINNDDSYTFFEKIGDGIDTGKLESNVSDLYIVYRK